MDKKLVTCGLFLDFSKAFDTVNHDILLSKLYSYGIRGNPLRWFESYLYNRNQVVKISDTISRSQTIICGIPQGSTLGPLLFLLYINDLPNCSSKLLLCFRIFADDTNMFYTSNNLRNLEHYSFIYPYLTYAITSWGSACKTRLNKIRTRQNKCIRSIFFAHSRENATPYYNLLDILKLDNIFKLKVALFAHKIINNPTGIPTIFSGTLPLASDFHSHYTRFVSNLS